jgi:hypothetical protein
MFYGLLQHLLITKKERESHSDSLSLILAYYRLFRCRTLRLLVLQLHTATLPMAMSTVRSVSRTSSSRSFSL